MVLITFLVILSIFSRTCVPWFLKLMMSLSSQVQIYLLLCCYILWLCVMLTELFVCRLMNSINWHRWHFAYLLLGFVYFFNLVSCIIYWHILVHIMIYTTWGETKRFVLWPFFIVWCYPIPPHPQKVSHSDRQTTCMHLHNHIPPHPTPPPYPFMHACLQVVYNLDFCVISV